jgi:hypothetical protein
MRWNMSQLLVACISSTIVVCSDLGSKAVVSQLYQFPKGTWIENLAARPSGNLILVRYDKPEIYELNPRVPAPTPKLLYSFGEGATAASGIAETSPDIYHVIVSTPIPNTLLSMDNAIWKIDFSSAEPNITKVLAKVPGVTNPLNGLAPVSPSLILASDTFAGVVHGIDLSKGDAYVATSSPGTGVNGLRTREGFLYYNQMIKGAFAKVPIDTQTGKSTGPIQTVAQTLGMIGIDDFALGKSGNEAFLCQFLQNQVLRVDFAKGSVETVAGNLLSKTITAPTSAQLGRTEVDERTLYVVTSSGQVLALKL